MKKEDIEKAAGDYSGSILGFRDNQFVMAKHKAFVDGANWRINSVWHDSSEHPNANTLIFCLTKDGEYFLYGKSQYYYEETVMDRAVIKWAYIEDLLPNM